MAFYLYSQEDKSELSSLRRTPLSLQWEKSLTAVLAGPQGWESCLIRPDPFHHPRPGLLSANSVQISSAQAWRSRRRVRYCPSDSGKPVTQEQGSVPCHQGASPVFTTRFSATGGVTVQSRNEWQNSSDSEDPTPLQVLSTQNTEHSNHPALSPSPFQPSLASFPLSTHKS